MSDARASTKSVRVVLALAIASLVCALGACGNDTPHTPDYGQPPDASQFNPGNGGHEPYGDGGAQDAGPPVCSDDLKRCAEEFDYPFNGETSVELRGDYRPGAWQQGDAMTHAGSKWSVTVPVPYAKPVQYKFIVDGTKWLVDPNNPQTIPDGNGNTNSLRTAITCTDYTCDEPPPPPPGVFDWRDAVIYFVFVDRFLDADPSNDCTVSGADSEGQYYGGDWKGVTQKISDGYFTDLGANVLWITVPVKNADTFAGHGVGGDTHMYSAYHGYWPYDVAQVEPCFGTQQDLAALVQAAHAKSIRVLFDYAMVHVQDTSPIYQQHSDWFWPNSFNGGNCICGQGCDWNAQAQQCWFTDYLPHWNYTNAAARDFSVNAVLQLVKNTGADGLRLDAIKHVDGSWLLELRQEVQSQIVANEKPPQRFYMVGETFDYSNQQFIASFVDPQTKLDGQFDFPERLNLVKAVLLREMGMDSLRGFMDQNDGYYGAYAVMSTFAGNHDLPRSIHLAEDTPVWSDPYADGKDRAWSNQPQLPGYRSPFERLANAFAVLLTNKGAPLVYYGDEIGLPGAGDPDNRRKMTFSGWTQDQQWLHDRVKTLAAIRAQHPALRRGTRQTISVTADVWLYSMTTSGDQVWVAINRGDSDQGISGLPSKAMQELVTSAVVNGPSDTVPARQTRIYVPK